MKPSVEHRARVATYYQQAALEMQKKNTKYLYDTTDTVTTVYFKDVNCRVTIDEEFCKDLIVNKWCF